MIKSLALTLEPVQATRQEPLQPSSTTGISGRKLACISLICKKICPIQFNGVIYKILLPNLIVRCDTALANLRQSRQSLNVTSMSSIRDELLCTLRRRSSRSDTPKNKSKKSAWQHKFVCLAHIGQEKVPLREKEKDELFVAGLGGKELEFDNLEASEEEFQETIFEGFPQLRDGGGYQFLRCIPNSRILEPLSGFVMSSPSVLKQRVGTARTYIRPLQRNLDTTPVRSMSHSVSNTIVYKI